MGLMEKVRVGKAVRPPRIVIYGGEGIGKSTWAATIPGVVFIPTESGIDNISCASFPLCSSLRDVINAIDALSMETHSYKGVVIDTATSLERLIHDDLLQTTKCASIEMVGGGYGKGYAMAAEKFRSVLSRLDLLRSEQGMASIVIAHGRAESFADPEGPAYDRWAPRLHKAIGSQLVEWADIVGFACRRQRTMDAGGRTVARPIGSEGGDRILRTQGGPSCVAKSRYEKIPAEVPLDWLAMAPYFGGAK